MPSGAICASRSDPGLRFHDVCRSAGSLLLTNYVRRLPGSLFISRTYYYKQNFYKLKILYFFINIDCLFSQTHSENEVFDVIFVRMNAKILYANHIKSL